MEKARENGILVIAASIIAVIRLSTVIATISDSVHLALMIMAGRRRREPLAY